MAEKTIVPLLDLKAQYASIGDEIARAIDEVVEAQGFIMGPNVKALEEEIAAYCGTPFAVGCASGSDAILLALMALNIKPGDEVICPAYTFFSTAGSIVRLGARPVFADIDPVTYNVDPVHVRRLAERCTRLKAIMPVHLFGQAADMDALLGIAAEHDVPVIEDAAQAIGTEDETGARAGSRGLIGCFSFYPTKNLGAFGDGGICMTNDADLAERIGILRVHGAKPKYYHEIVGLNSRLDALQAAILRVKLKYLDLWTEGRRRNAASYDEAFAAAGAKTSAHPLDEDGLPLRTPAPAPAGARHIYNQYVIRVPAAIRDELRAALSEKGIGTEIYYPVPLHLQKCFSDLNGRAGDLPHSERAAAETIALPIYPELTQAQREHVVQTTVSFVGRHAAVRA
ncbi:MAG: DegT/DnrJ/EryC1/StrS family aminotransferase [Planctomycetota bacterium]|nr:DegT/DnrJ/EryC1/StrS family aminotransferase [Planctomycetota bacterium]